MATDSKGLVIEADQFTSMEYRNIDPDTVTPRSGDGAVPTLPAKDVPAGTEVTVTTVDEFLEAIGPDRTIVLDGTDFDLSKADNYGGLGTQYYRWDMTPDGPQLIIHDVDNLTIKAKDSDPPATTLEALPRYATVLTFNCCTNVTVAGFTVYNCKIHDNKAAGLLYNAETENVVFLSSEVTKNTFTESVFNFAENGATVDGCRFEDINCTYWYPMDTQFSP